MSSRFDSLQLNFNIAICITLEKHNGRSVFINIYHIYGSSLCLLIIEACTWFCRAGISGNLKPVEDFAAIFRLDFSSCEILDFRCLNSKIARHPKVYHLFYPVTSKLTTVSNDLWLSVKYHDQFIVQLHPSEVINQTGSYTPAAI